MLTPCSELCLVGGPEASDLRVISINTVPVGQVSQELQSVRFLFSKNGSGSLIDINAIATKILISETSFFKTEKKCLFNDIGQYNCAKSRMQSFLPPFLILSYLPSFLSHSILSLPFSCTTGR